MGRLFLQLLPLVSNMISHAGELGHDVLFFRQREKGEEESYWFRVN